MTNPRIAAILAASLLALAGWSTVGLATPIAPNDPGVSASLSAWFSDPASLYSPATGVWTDSSGNNNHTSIESGSVALNLTTATPSSGLFNGQTLDVVTTDGAVDLLETPALNGGNGSANWTIIGLVYYASTSDSNKRPVGIGSNLATGAANRPHFNPAADGSLRRDDGFVAGSGPVPNRYFIRGSVLSGNGAANASINDFFFDDTGSGFFATQNMSNKSYGKVATGNDIFYIGDLQSNKSGIGVAQVAVYSTALSNQQVSDIAEWIAQNPNAVPEPSTFALAAIGLLGLMGCRRRRSTKD